MTAKVEKTSDDIENYSITEEGETSIWNFKEFKENEYWFLKVGKNKKLCSARRIETFSICVL